MDSYFIRVDEYHFFLICWEDIYITQVEFSSKNGIVGK